MKVNRAQLAEILDVSLPSVDRFVRDGMPVERRGRKGTPSRFDAGSCVTWLRRRDAKRLAPLPQTYGRQPRASRMQLRGILRAMWLPQDSLLPWHPGTPDVVRLLEYEERIGLPHASGEIIDWFSLGFPTLPPAPGEKLLRVPFRQAELWRLMFGGLVQCCGGDGSALLLGREYRKLAGMPLCDDEDA